MDTDKIIAMFSDLDNLAIKMDAIVEAQIDFLCGMDGDKIDSRYHERLFAMSEILRGIVEDMRETLDKSPVA